MIFLRVITFICLFASVYMEYSTVSFLLSTCTLLQQYSLITTVRNEDQLVLRLHLLTQAWARDTLEAGKARLYEEAAMRILMCYASYLMGYDHQSFILQVNLFQQSITHVNDRAVLAYAYTFSSPLSSGLMY
jgi:hypothetical protein